MIRHLKRNQIDETKYNNLIKASINSRIYAFSWYLDCVADNWDVLILNDYEAVMPLPWRQKYFIKYIYPPAWTQQLGVFSSTKISEKLVLDFIHAIPKRFKKITIQFNSENKLQHKNVTERINYVLPLHKSYSEIYKSFNQNRKRDINKFKNKNLTIDVISIDDLIEIAKKYYFYLGYTNDDYLKLKALTNVLLEKEEILLFGIYDFSKKLTGGILLLKDDFRITYLFSVMNEEGFKNKVPTFLLCNIIEEFSNSNYLLDFEGSMDLGISRFFKSFGAKSEPYFRIEAYGV